MDDVERVARAIHQSDEDTMTLLHIDVKPWAKITDMEKEAYTANARAALAAMGPVWRPIETAPKDGTQVDLWVVSNIIPQASWRFTNCVWAYISDDRVEYHGWVKADDFCRGERFISTDVETATHWMPQPAAPQEGDDG